MLRILSNIKLILIFLVSFSLQYSFVLAADIFVVQSARFPVYNTALRGFENVVLRDFPAHGQKSVLPHTITTSILVEENNPQNLKRRIIRQNPEAIVAVGSSSLSLVKDVAGIPIIYLLVPDPTSIINDRPNVTGVNMELTAGQQLAALTGKSLGGRRIGMLYDPERTGALVMEAVDFARNNDLIIVARPVKTPREVPVQLADLRGKIDWLWMTPDQTVVTPETLDYMFLFSLENRVPILTFAEKYLKLGAVLSASFDAEDMGRQAGELTLKVLQRRVSEFPPFRARKVNVRVNQTAAKTMGIDISD